MKYWFIQNGVQLGPVEAEDLRKLSLSGDTPVWSEGMADWQKAKDVPELADLFNIPTYTAPQPQQQPEQTQTDFNAQAWRPQPETYLVWNILALVFCCVPLAIPGIVYSAMVSSRYQSGDYDGAVRASNTARNWLIASVVTGIVFNGVMFLSSIPAAFLSSIAAMFQG